LLFSVDIKIHSSRPRCEWNRRGSLTRRPAHGEHAGFDLPTGPHAHRDNTNADDDGAEQYRQVNTTSARIPAA
jgi:hypothetical protein